MKIWLWLASALSIWLGCEQLARAETALHALIVASNHAAFPGLGDSPRQLGDLHYADDDAAAFHEFVSPIASSLELLTTLDARTQALYPGLATRAGVPTLEGVRAAVARLRRRLEQRSSEGDRNVVLFFFSGHGALADDGRPALGLFDGGMTQDFLYREVLARLPADEVHLLVDACHAEAVVRPRDATLEAKVVNVSMERASAFLVDNTLARFPHVGAIVAAASADEAHEWDRLQHGVFTHELLSALRGAADINHDRRIEYSEVYAFMSAANRQISDARARLSIVAKPPDANRRAALVSLAHFPRQELSWLSGVPGSDQIIEVSDERGRRLCTLHGDHEFRADLLLPARSRIYVRGGDREASFVAAAGEVVRFERLRFESVPVRERSPLDDALRRGLFAAAFGRSYYTGVVDQVSGFIAVDFTDARDAHTASFWAAEQTPWTLGDHKLVFGVGMSAGVASLVPITHGLNVGIRPATGSGPMASLRALSATDGPLHEWSTSASVGWLWSLAYGPARGWIGPALSAGMMTQEVDGQTARRSPGVGLGPVLGLSADVSRDIGMWSELELSGVLLRRDNRPALSLFPSAWLGGSLRF